MNDPYIIHHKEIKKLNHIVKSNHIKICLLIFQNKKICKQNDLIYSLHYAHSKAICYTNSSIMEKMIKKEKYEINAHYLDHHFLGFSLCMTQVYIARDIVASFCFDFRALFKVSINLKY